MRKEKELPAELEEGMLVAVFATLIIFHGTAWLLWQIPFPFRLAEFSEHFKHWVALKVNEIAPPLFQLTADHYRAFLNRPEVNSSVYVWRFNFALVFGVLAGCFLGYLVGKPKSSISHVKGHRIWEGEAAVKRLLKKSLKECKESAQGLHMHPTFKWRLSTNRETRHFLIIGGSGGGKTQIITPIIRAAIERKDRILVYDVKGDFTSTLPNIILIAPWDKRSLAWDVAKDCINKQDARQLAAKLIPEGHDPVWHSAARQILAAVLIKLQSEKGTTWTWTDLFNQTCANQSELLACVKEYLPEAIHTLNAPGKTTQSILINFGSNMSLLSDLASAWGNKPPNMRFSFRAWLKNGNTPHRTVILQGSGAYDELAKSYIGAIVSFVSGFINSPSYPDSTKRRIWLFLDEFPQLGELKNVAKLLAVARSKGVRFLLSAQDVSQIKAIYGEHNAATWMSNAATMIITQISSGETANFVSKEIIGYQTRNRTEIYQGKLQPSIRETVPVVEPSELQTELGLKSNVVKAIVLGYGDAYLLDWPAKFPQGSDFLRPSSVEAHWLKHTAATVKNMSLPSQAPNIQKKNSGSNEGKLKLVLRAPSQSELIQMAQTGTPATLSAESTKLLSETAAGGNHE